ncbi:hypothetical protein GCM10027445_33470 [Amycolatopsis endophytica]|uniref:Glycosyltransferase RgtA/B/C/D-like domain-containing protein n=1 Tax=Amycolatopsis endophytica TaxID=860233 RepID=A0A853B093_9PSEU|nr:glycosyltransferase family 39 protein [Amycolatopsis endophytica]NYI88410.1 hypothetical protein [Amycolatopsis endophytica]
MVTAPAMPPARTTERPLPVRETSARWQAAAAVAGGMALIALQGARLGNWIVDDAAITFGYARNLSEGLGPVVQPGADAVEGYSNPTWTALLALGRLIGLFDHGTIFGIPDYVLFPKALGLLCCGGILVAFHSAAAMVTRRPWVVTLVAGAVLAAIPSFVIWTFSGLENPLYALAVVTLAVVTFRAVLSGRLRTWQVATLTGVLAAVAALTRPEGAIYAAVYPVVVLIHLRRATLRSSIGQVLVSVAAFAVPFGGYVLWRWLEFGRLVANTAVAKRQGLPEIGQLTRAGDLVQYAGALAVLVLVVLVGLALARSSWWRDGLITLLVPLGLALAAYAVLEPDWMAQFRFATPVWALSALIGALAATEVFRNTRARGRVLLCAALVVTLVPSVATLERATQKFQAQPTLPMCFIADRFGKMFNQYADILGVREGSVLEPDLGGTSLTSRLHVVDLAGLVDDEIADFYHDRDMGALREHVFEEVKPTFIHFRMYWGGVTGIAGDPRLERDYVPLYVYPAPADFGGDFVRRDAVTDPTLLAAARDYANENVASTESKINVWGLRKCGDRLTPGQTDLGVR